MHTAAQIALAADRLDILDVDGGETRTLALPETYRSARSGAVLRLGETTVLLAAPPRTNAYEFSMEAFAIADDGRTTELGVASQLLPATRHTVWLAQRRDGLPTVRLVGLDGTEKLAPQTLPPQTRVVGGASSTVLLGAFFGDMPTRIVDWDPTTGQVVAVLAESGLVHDADQRHVLWQDCAECPLQAYDRVTGASSPASSLPDGSRLGGRAQLAHDGRHWSVAAATAEAPSRRSIVIGHLANTENADSTSTVLNLPAIGRSTGPRMSWSSSGWLFVSTGYSLWTVSPEPHHAFMVDADDHYGIAAN